ncbi:Eco57I restriction-modification methylase domain-containing protein [Mycobacteroides chelonae]|jgi:hypothetical protein|uniref:site-specific DNA-methyltransferase (adenine-specific) n=1 Tax=Mycobacteroides chelonae TaxID=1774 RepID=A0AB73LIL1_MYCCH|nr:Eco57I restriction-modification methylase domain-containing protein [Mycobacteroides chelonae]MBF9328597.1 SAM-dependent methyltransferase [Mycobacteroides chelonae]MBF9422776.1 SAM-dependent methyltransferase [Mycobacteroides chelonae]MBF9435157.1 SAM-dependent methyltransferase [Mycobacteroides chelonae]MBV6362512.1 Eco57I restriction-modification methylase domain-containing protein [Mycobacteroides chelonae]MEC4836763.1 TaqI-like C-terminal specificity domain-containing protein [Mycobact
MTTAKRIGEPIALGAVHTRAWVVEMMLDLADYTADGDLTAATAVEPSVGYGAFLVPMVQRLLRSCADHGRRIASTSDVLCAFDLDPDAVEVTRGRAAAELRANGVSRRLAQRLAAGWIRHGDFLLEAPVLPAVRWVVGNPPYVRIEDVSRPRLLAYRRLWSAMHGRADVYVGFLQAGLSVLAADGTMTTICSDRWMRNQYGAGLRSMIADDFSVDLCVSMYAAQAFESDVAAYPAVTRIRRGTQGDAMTFAAPTPLTELDVSGLVKAWRRGPDDGSATCRASVDWAQQWFDGSDSWPNARSAQLASIERRLPTLAEAGVTVSAGPATGADKIYITSNASAVETDRLVPVIGASEVREGDLRWSGRFLVNPWTQDGLVELADYPMLREYLQQHRQRLADRHTAKARPDQWWRTIDRVKPEVVAAPKLLIPDIKERIFPVLDRGQFVPMHNLYFAVAPKWDLRVLGGLLMSDLATQFVTTYSVRMANGYYRVSAQYLRRVRIPFYGDIPVDVRRRLRSAFQNRDLDAANTAATIAYGLANQ